MVLQPISLSIIIPVYNSQDSIPLVAQRLSEVLPTITGTFEVIMVEDDSRDQSWQQIEQAMQQYDWLHGVKLMRNYGQHNALLCGIRQARYDVIVTMDDDLQHPPEELPALLHALQSGYDVVYGSPQRQQHGFLRDMASQVTKRVLQNAMGAETASKISAFRAFRTRLRDGFAHYAGPYVNLDVLLTWSTTRFTSVTVRHDERPYGHSNYTLAKLITHTFNMMTGFTTMPLKLASMLGFALTLFGIVLLFYIIVVRILIFGYDVPGFTFLASIISIFAGAQMFVLGIIGEYLARMHFRLMDKPSFVVRYGHNSHLQQANTETNAHDTTPTESPLATETSHR